MDNINQITDVQPTQSIEPIKKSNIFKYLFIASIIVILALIIGFYFLLNNKINQLSNKQTTELTPDSIQKPTNSEETIPTIIPTIISTESTLIEKDTNNNLYTNNKFGFSLIIPKFAIGSIECKKETDSYRPKSGNVSINFFENKETIYLAADNFYRLTGEQKTSEGISNFSGCEKLKTNFELIEEDKVSSGNITSLKIYAANIKNDDELEQFIKSKYGLGCKLGKKTKLDTTEVFDVSILGDGKDLGESECPMNFMVKLRYNQTKSKLVLFELGQACNLAKNSTGNSCYDFEIVDSLKFN